MFGGKNREKTGFHKGQTGHFFGLFSGFFGSVFVHIQTIEYKAGSENGLFSPSFGERVKYQVFSDPSFTYGLEVAQVGRRVVTYNYIGGPR